MLSTVLIVLTCVSGIVSVYGPYQGQNSGYQQPYASNRYDIKQDIKHLYDLLEAAFQGNEPVVDRLKRVSIADDLNTRRRADFVDSDYIDVRKIQGNQSENVGDLFKQVNQQVLLVDDATVLKSQFQELQRQSSQVLAETVQLNNFVNSQNNTDVQQEKRLSLFNSRLAAQERRTAQLENATRKNQEILRQNDLLLANITNTVDNEQAEIVSLFLTKENPSASRIIDRDFKGISPYVFYGLSSLRIEDNTQSYVLPTNYATKGYNGYTASFGNGTINFFIVVKYELETTSVHATLVDASTGGLSVISATAEILVINIANRLFNPPTALY